MAFFGNDAVNRVNLHYSIQAIAGGAGGAFTLVFLLHSHLSVAATLAIMGAIVVGRFLLRPLILPLGKRWGLKPLLIGGAVLMAVQYPMLALVQGLNLWLWLFIVTTAVSDVLYWPTYHAYFAAIGDAEHRGQQIGAREALSAVVGIVAPLIGAWGLVTAGPMWTFSLAAIVQVLSALPLLGGPNVAVPPSAPEAYRAAWRGMGFFLSDGWLAACFYFTWQVALFVSLGDSLAAYGGAVALAALVGAVAGLVLGRYIDLGHGRRAVLIAYGVTGVVTLLRAAGYGTPWLAVIANALGALVTALATPAMMAAVYNLAKASPCSFRFHIVGEAGWDVGCASGMFVAAGLAAMGVSLSVVILLAVLSALANTWLLWRYYGDHPDAADVAIPAEPAYLAESHPPI